MRKNTPHLSLLLGNTHYRHFNIILVSAAEPFRYWVKLFSCSRAIFDCSDDPIETKWYNMLNP